MSTTRKLSLLFSLPCLLLGEEYGLFLKEPPKANTEAEFSYVLEKNPPIKNEIACDRGSHTMQLGVRHSQGAGIGYTHGYTTLDGFISLEHCDHSWTPFLDLRGHIFNNARYAANAGIGLRYVGGSIAWGINSYYDYRNTHEFHYNQWGLGLEAIGPFWSIHVNGYLPFGKKRSPFFDPGFIGTPSSPSFAFFQGNQFFITLSGTQALAVKQEFALKGIDTKCLLQVVKKGILAFDIGFGPYYFEGAFGKYAAGGEASLTLRLGDYVSLSATGSYDNLFHERGQGAIAFSIPFGPRNFNKHCKEAAPCAIPSFFNAKLAKGAHRSEIVVLDRHRKILATATPGGTEVAINPDTGEPYVVWFVNNQSSSDGTFESPYPTIQEAVAASGPNDMIYVYPGDGSPYDIDIALQDDQLLLGSGVAQNIQTTQGIISIPAQSNTAPNLENSIGATMITVANRNTISGFHFNPLNAGNIIVASEIDSLSFQNNLFSTSVTIGMNNLAFTDCIGALLIQNNQFIMDVGDTGSFGINLSDAGSGASTLSVFNNTFSNHAARAIGLNYSGSSSPTLRIGNNAFTPSPGYLGTAAIDIATSNATALAGSISNLNDFSGYTANVINVNWGGSGNHALAIAGNTIASDPSISGTNGIILFTNASGTSDLTVSSNQFANQTSNGINCFAADGAKLHVVISHNTLAGTSEPGNNGIQVGGTDTSTVTGSITNNICSEHLGGNINGFPSGSSSLTLTIANNTLAGPSIVPSGSFPNGIQFNGNGSCHMDLTIKHNQLTNHADRGINIFSSDDAAIVVLIDGNTIVAPISTSNTSGITVGGNNSSSTPLNSYTITNNLCSGQNNGIIQCFPSNYCKCELIVSHNTMTSVKEGISGSGPIGVQVSATNNSTIISATITDNTWTSPNTYQTTGTPQGFSVGGSNDSSLSDIMISENIATLPFTAYKENTGPSAIQFYLNDNAVMSGLAISNNSVSVPTAAYISNSGISGIQVSAQSTGSLTEVTIDEAKHTANGKPREGCSDCEERIDVALFDPSKVILADFKMQPGNSDHHAISLFIKNV